MAPTNLSDYSQALFPVVLYAIKVMATVAVVIGGALLSVLVWIGKGVIGSQKELNDKVAKMLNIIMHCENCRQSVDGVSGGKRWDDPPPDDEEVLP